MATEPDLARLREIFIAARSRSGLTFDQLAERSGLGRQTLLNISAGRYHGDLRTWLLLSQAFETSLDELLASIWESRES